jgi:hypothetical protein
MKGKRKWLLCPLIIVALLLCAIPAYADTPTLPHAFYGTLTIIGGSPAPVGTVVTAKVGGVQCGSITTTVEGQYGGSGPADYFVMQGTSMASPVAAGAAALLLEANPELKGHPADVRTLLQSTATSVEANDDIDGYGLLDIQAAIDASASELEADWLFMVYLDADNNLESAGIDDLNEMEVAGSTDRVKIVVQMDRAERDYDDDTTNGNWTGAKRFYVTQDTDQAIINSPVIDDLGEVNMGDPAVLQSFIEWAIANYPAQHYALVLWNHGSGWREGNNSSAIKSVCIDDQANDELTMTELRSALNAANATTGEVLDIVGFDACLMQMVEVAYQVMGSAERPLVDITVGSEETEPGDG